MREMIVKGIRIDDTFAEAFRMRYVRLIVTAHDRHWLDAGLREFTGYSSSVIARVCRAAPRWVAAPDVAVASVCPRLPPKERS